MFRRSRSVRSNGRHNGLRLPLNEWLVILAVPLCHLSLCHSQFAGDWPQWRGPHRDAVNADESGLLVEWELPPPVVWRADRIGDGYSSLAVADGRVFTLGKHGSDVHCVALDLEMGKTLWSQAIGSSNRHAMSTPTVQDGLVYALDPDGELNCLTADRGELVWKKDIAQEFSGRLMSSRGHGESPLIDGDRLICTPGGLDAIMVALNRRTGEVIWKATMPAIGEKGRDGACFSSAVVSEAAGIRQYVQLTGRGLIGIDAETGRFLWGYNDISNGTVNIPTPLVKEDYVFCANGYNAGSVLLKLEPGGETGVTPREIYRLRGTDFQNHHGGVALIDGHIYGGHGSNNGLPTCVEFATGKVKWKRRGPGVGSAAIAAADGHLVFRYQNGVVAWVAATPERFSLHGTFEISGAAGDSWSHPVIAHGRLFLREQSSVWVHDLVNPGTGDSPPPPPTTNIPEEWAALRILGVAIERLPFEERLWHTQPLRKRFNRFAIADKDNAIVRAVLITASDDHLTDDGTLTPEFHDAIRQFPGPFVLHIGESRLSDAGLEQIAQLEELRGLNVELCHRVTDAGFAHLAKAERLRVLAAMGTAISQDGLKPLVELPQLVAIDLEVCDHVLDAECETLSEFPAIRALNLKKTAFEPARITPTGIAHLSKLRRLEVLNLYANDVTDDSLADIGKLTRLRELDLSLTGITDKGLAHLQPLEHLRRLHLLYAVGFAGPAITDAGIPSLLAFPRLLVLDLTGSSVSDTGLAHLAELDSLRQLELSKTQVSSAGLRQFQVDHPKCRVGAFLAGE